MSLSRTEYLAALAILTDRAGEDVTLQVGAGRVRIVFQEQAPVRLGGLLQLPRATVTLTFEAVAPQQQDVFVQLFDRTFQRGGG